MTGPSANWVAIADESAADSARGIHDTGLGLRECLDCGLVQRLPAGGGRRDLECGRCGARLHSQQHGGVPLAFALGVLGLTLLTFGLGLPMVTVSMGGGRFATSHLLTGAVLLQEQGAWALGVVVFGTLLLLPALKFLAVVLAALGVWLSWTPRWLRKALGWVDTLATWSMMDVFLLGATISLVRLGAWMQVDVEPALIALGGVALCSLIMNGLDLGAFWRAMPARAAVAGEGSSSHAGGHGMGQDTGRPLASCSRCHAWQEDRRKCARCGSRVRVRKEDSLNRTLALVITAFLLAIPANVLPVMTIHKSGTGGPSTILGGTVELAEKGFVGLAVLVFVASIIVPLFKLGVLCVLMRRTVRPEPARLRLWTRLFRFVAMIGRWSMLDIFATMTLVAMARFGWVGSVLPEAGATAFCAVVLVTMLAVETFDPRLMWDAAGLNANVGVARPGAARKAST